MTLFWMTYAVVVAGLLGVAAAAGERLLRHRGLPGRGSWLAALAGSVAVPLLGWLSLGPGSSLGATLRGWIPAVSPGEPPAGGEAGSTVLGVPEVVSGWAAGGAGGLSGLAASLEAPLLAVWLASSAALAGVVVATAVTLRRRARLWGSAVLKGEPVLVSPDTGPAVLGLRRPRVVLPSWALALAERSLEVVLLHEREHVEGRDTWLVNAGLVAVVLMPWNPALWWQLRRLRLAVELDCDRRVLERGVSPRRYGDVLLEVEGRMGGTALNALGLGNPATSLRRRLEMMRDESWLRGWKLGLIAFAGLAALAVACEAPLPMAQEEAVEESAAEEPAAAGELAEEPTPTPHTRAPEVMNREEVAAALEEAYPQELRDAGERAEVVLHIFIDEEGTVRNVEVGDPSDHEEADRAALEVAEAFEFSPARNEGERVPVWITLPVRFEPE